MMGDLRDTPVCPYCSHREKDAWEINFGPGLEGEAEVTCGACGEDYRVERVVNIYYRSAK